MRRDRDFGEREALNELLRELGSAGAVSAAVALIGDRHGVLSCAASGCRSRVNDRAPTTGSLFDLASLAKPMTATLALALDRADLLPLPLRLGEIWHRPCPALAKKRLGDLLRHRAGLEPWAPLYALASSREEAAELLLSGRLLGDRSVIYSDLGYILWGLAAERVMGQSLDSLLRRWVLQPLGMSRQTAITKPDERRLVECRLDTSRERVLAKRRGFELTLGVPERGQVQDGNARWWNGYAGHAGLFGSALGLWRLGAEWLAPRYLQQSAVDRALRGRGRLRLGWWSRRVRGSAGPALGPRAFGHTGFTGGSLWIDPDADRVFVLVAHRPFDSIDLDPWRRRFHALA